MVKQEANGTPTIVVDGVEISLSKSMMRSPPALGRLIVHGIPICAGVSYFYACDLLTKVYGDGASKLPITTLATVDFFKRMKLTDLFAVTKSFPSSLAARAKLFSDAIRNPTIPNITHLTKAMSMLPSFKKIAMGVGVFSLLPVGLYIACRDKSVSSKLAGRIIPKVMENVDYMFRDARTHALAAVKGKVLDLGAGGGAYARYVAKAGDKVEKYVALEPNVNCHPTLNKTISKASLSCATEVVSCFSHELLEKDGERGSYDFVILGNMLCEVPDQVAVLSDVKALLKPGGVVYFSEHIAANKDTVKRQLQETFNPWWHTVSDGCNANRDTGIVLADELKGWEMATWPYKTGGIIIDDFIIGLAIKPSN